MILFADVDEDSPPENISTKETLDVLALEGSFDNLYLARHIIRKQEPYVVIVAGYIRGRWRGDIGYAYRA